MTMTDARTSAEAASDLTIASVEAIRLKLPYKKPISFASLTESTGQYVILRSRSRTAPSRRPTRPASAPRSTAASSTATRSEQ